MKYAPKYTEWLRRGDVRQEQLTAHLQQLIEKFQAALREWSKATPAEQSEYLSMLEKSDAFIAASIYRLGKPAPKTASVDKVKLLALKAKALQINMND